MKETGFKTQTAVHQWLMDNDWQLSKSQLNLHCRDGLLRKDKESKLYLIRDVKKYAKLHVKKATTGQKVDEYEEQVRRRKLDISLRKEELELEKAEHDRDKRKGKYIPKEHFELAIVARAVAFMAHINHAIQTLVPDWIELVEGDQRRAPELVEAVSQAVEQRMGDFAADAEFDVILEPND